MNKDLLIKILERISSVTAKLASFLIVALVFLVFANVLLRFFKLNRIDLQELEWHFFAASFLLGIAPALKDDAHVRVDLFYSKLSEHDQKMINFFGLLLAVIPFCLVLFYHSIDFSVYAFTISEGSGDPDGLPFRFIIKSFLPLSLALVIIQSLALCLKLFFDLSTTQKEEAS